MLTFLDVKVERSRRTVMTAEEKAAKHRLYSLTYRTRHPERARECSRLSAQVYRETHREEIREKERLYMASKRATNPELRAKDKERLGAYGKVYDAKQRGLPHSFKAADWRRALAHFDHKCAYCGEKSSLDREHFVPQCRNGGYEATNIVPACHKCNMDKRGQDPFKWLANRPAVLWSVTAYLWGVVGD